MIRALVERQFNETLKYVELAGVHDDSKPTAGIVTGSTFIEADTGDIYVFCEGDTPAWNKLQAGPTAAES